MKIGDHIPFGKTEKSTFDGVRRINSTSSGFDSHLKEHERENLYEYLNEMRLKIEKQGEKLAQTANINELRYYKKMVSDFLQQAVNAACIFEKESISDRRGRRHVYSLVKKVNERVEDLVKQVMEKEKNHIEILKTTEDIRGMLLDLIM